MGCYLLSSRASEKENYEPPDVQTTNAQKNVYGSHHGLIAQIAMLK
jgi:hypothetical protein